MASEHSAPLLLNVSLDDEDDAEYTDSDIAQPVIREIVKHSWRWRTLSLNVVERHIPPIFAYPTPNLKSLRVNNVSEHDCPLSSPSFISVAPQLTELDLTSVTIPEDVTHFPNLQTLKLAYMRDTPLPFESFIRMLRSSTQLYSLEADFCRISVLNVSRPPHTEMTRLPALRHVSLCDMSVDFLEAFIDYVELPSIEELQMKPVRLNTLPRTAQSS